MSKKNKGVWDAEAWQTYRRLIGYTSPYKLIVVLTVLGMAVDVGCLALFTKLIQPMLDDMFTHKSAYLIFWMPIWILSIFVVRAFGTFASDYGIAYVGRNVVQVIRQQVFAAYLRLPAPFFSEEASGHQIARITYTSEQVASATTDSLKVMVTESLMVVSMLGVMLFQSIYLTLALFVLAPTVLLIATVVSRRYRRISGRIQDMMGTVTGAVEEAVNAHREVRIYGGQDSERERFDEVAERTRTLNLKVSMTSSLSSSTVQTMGGAAIAALVLLATRPGVLGHMSPGIFFSVLTAMGAMMPSLKRLTGVQGSVQRGLIAAKDLFGILDRPPEIDSGTLPISRCVGDITFSGVHLSYRDSTEEALRGVNLHCRPGTVTALVGRSGSGKSSLASLLPRFYEPTAGQVLLDGHALDDYLLADLRQQIAWVGQNVVMFDDTVANNIAYGELAGASEQDIVAAAEVANAMEFISRMPQGLQSRVGERGGMLSGGQRQRIAIARAILKNAPILVLDEATSALDTESERLIQQALQRLMKDRTTLVIAHRLSTIEHADQIAVMDQGRIVERGTHAELLELGGQYAALHRMQFHNPGSD
ncbi:lipid A export permease/ATP-binding protein MsbA [Dyella halodurans]|uniref:Lipid A export permease/ATP-binding protein MsbA n=1 Tax=Dyella halodurans TaxID=1920171 RepID=A0ABV9C0S6_9GAMM|nr:lipid A export permease/ATP-binding protein MsbA [Dyella halodurans]